MKINLIGTIKEVLGSRMISATSSIFEFVVENEGDNLLIATFSAQVENEVNHLGQGEAISLTVNFKSNFWAKGNRWFTSALALNLIKKTSEIESDESDDNLGFGALSHKGYYTNNNDANEEEELPF